jgi:sn-1 stearoyl-lipid 9-desaturase
MVLSNLNIKSLEYICATLGMISCSGSALRWAGIHRNHHKHSDTDKDPHQADRGLLAMLSIDYYYKPAPKDAD